MRPAGLPLQPPPADLDAPLFDVTFCVVDLETTGGSPATSRIAEVGAVKVRGGEVVGEFHTLVDPEMPIPPAISALTGITDGLVSGYPPVSAVLPAFLEFAGRTALVAHNAGFDTAFLDAALARLDYPRLAHPVVCTAALARRLVRDEVRDCKLLTLARRLGARTVPDHRALTDARATVDVLHALLERAGRYGVATLADLVDFTRARNAPLFARRRGLAEGLPAAPGVYAFRSAGGEVLYVGKATDLRARIRRYFTGDDRKQITDLLKEAEAVEHVVCPTPIEAAVRELRLIAAHRPRFNRRSKSPPAPVYVRLTTERFPRLSVVRRARPGGGELGPLPGRRVAAAVVEALEDVVAVRRCRAPIRARATFPACALAEMGRCPAPCEHRIDPDAYAALLEPVRRALAGDGDDVLARCDARMRRLAAAGRFAEAASARDRAAALAGALSRQRLRTWVSAAGELTAAVPRRGGWDVVGVRDGRLVWSRTCGPDELPAAGGGPPVAATPACPPALEAPADELAPAEVELIGRWLEQPGARVLWSTGAAAEPVAGGRALAEHRERLRQVRRRTGRPEDEVAARRLRRAG